VAGDEILETLARRDDLDAPLLLDRLFRRHPESTRTMGVMHWLDGMTFEQVARDCGMSVSGVRKRLARCAGRWRNREDHEWRGRDGPRLQLERYRLQELPSDEQQAVAGAAERSEAIRARLAALDRSDRELLALHPPGHVAEAVRMRAGRRLVSRRPRASVPSSWSPLRPQPCWSPSPSWCRPRAGRRRPCAGGGTRIKGLRSGPDALPAGRPGGEPLTDGRSSHARRRPDLYVAAASRYGVVVSIDGRAG